MLQLLFDARFLGHALGAGRPPAPEQAAPAPGPRGGAPGAAGAAQTARKKAFAGLEAALQVPEPAHAHAQQQSALSESVHKALSVLSKGYFCQVLGAASHTHQKPALCNLHAEVACTASVL